MKFSSVSRRAVVVLTMLTAGLVWPPNLAAAPAAPSPSDPCFVRGLYQDLLSRAPDAAEYNDGVNFLGSNTRGDYALSLLTGNVYRTLLIDGWYQRFLGRAPGPDLPGWLTAFSGGAKDEDIQAAILGSVEYNSLAGGTSDAFIKAVYVQVLGRNPLASDYSTWELFLGTHTHAQMAQIILTSVEYRTDLIEGWYQRYLGRGTIGPELSAEISLIGGPGGSDEQALTAVLGSDLYFARAGLCRVFLPLARR